MIRSLLASSVVFLSVNGCTPRYAIIAVSTVDAVTGRPLFARIYSGKDANYLGDTPALNYLVTRKSLDKSKTLCLIAEAEKYKTEWQMVQVLKWSKSAADAHDAPMLNKVLFIMPPSECLSDNNEKK